MHTQSSVTALIATVKEQLLLELTADQPVCVAFSGGVDSTVLLHALVQIGGRPLRAVYVDHGLQPESIAWGEHAQSVCEEWGVTCTQKRVQVDESGGKGLEAAAREARYAALQEQLQVDEALLTAHHELDQLETFLLQMLRGAGVHGLAAMPARTQRRGYLHLRPMLGIPMAQIHAYAEAEKLSWIDDPSNLNVEFDRNFLRKEVVPRLLERWPAATQSVARSARLNAEAAGMLDELAQMDGGDVIDYRRLSVASLAVLSAPRQKNLLRYLLRSWRLPIPSAAQLDEALLALLAAGDDRQPLAAWPGARVRRFRDTLWFFSESGDPGASVELAGQLSWDAEQPLDLGGIRGRLEVASTRGTGIALRCLHAPVSVRFRQGGESLRPATGGRTRELKKLLQESDVVPWMRGHIPLVYAGEELLAVGDLWVNADSLAGPNEEGRTLIWTDHAPIS